MVPYDSTSLSTEGNSIELGKKDLIGIFKFSIGLTQQLTEHDEQSTRPAFAPLLLILFINVEFQCNYRS